MDVKCACMHVHIWTKGSVYTLHTVCSISSEGWRLCASVRLECVALPELAADNELRAEERRL